MVDFAPPPPPPPPPYDVRPRHILLVEDHEPTARPLARLLAGYGHLVTLAHTLADAKALCEDVVFGAVLCDLRLPDGSGLDLIPCAHRGDPRPRFIALTGSVTDPAVPHLRRAGVDAIVYKPFSLRDVLAALGP